MDCLIKDFKHLSMLDVAIAGGKGASLGEMFNTGIPVPDGFVVLADALADAFEKFINKTGLSVEIDNALDSVG